MLGTGPQLPAEATLLQTSGLHKIIDYPARDMTITVEAGMTIAALQAELAKESQQLPIDIATPAKATLGGAIAANASGPRRFGYGTFRDYVIGISAVDGQGRLFSAGGKVVKNVAGYDLCKLLVGSRGTLGTITQVTLKLRPQSDSSSVVIVPLAENQSVETILVRLNKSETRPVYQELINPSLRPLLNNELTVLPQHQSALLIGFEGSSQETSWQAETISAELKGIGVQEIHTETGDVAAQILETLVNDPAGNANTCQFNATFPKAQTEKVLSLANQNEIAIQIHAGNGIAKGTLNAQITSPTAANDAIAPLRRFVESHQGALTVTAFPADWTDEFKHRGHTPQARSLMTGIRQQLDPRGLMNPQLSY